MPWFESSLVFESKAGHKKDKLKLGTSQPKALADDLRKITKAKQAEEKSHNDIIDAPTVILESNKLVELHSEDEFTDFINRLRSKINSVIKIVEETEELTLEVW